MENSLPTESVEVLGHAPEAAPPYRRAKQQIVLIGASGHARVILDILQLTGTYEIVGLIDSFKPRGISLGGHEILGSPDEIPALVDQGAFSAAIVCVGDNWTRARIVDGIRRAVPNFTFVSAIHPAATVSRDAVIGEGTVIMAGAVVNPGCQVGEYCIINTRASLDHDSVMDSYSSLGPGVTTGGCVRIDAYSAIGIGATILQDLHIGRHTVVGAAAAVFHNLPDSVVAYGVPARIIRSRQPGDRYLSESKTEAGGAR